MHDRFSRNLRRMMTGVDIFLFNFVFIGTSRSYGPHWQCSREVHELTILNTNYSLDKKYD